MRTRLLIRPVIDAYVLTYSIDSSNYLQFTTSTTLQVGNTVVIDNITLPTIITDITSVSNGLYTTSTSWYDDLPVGGTIVNVLNNSDPTQAPDETFDTLNSPNGPVYTVSEVLSDSSYLIGGAFGLYQGQSYSNMVRVNEDGSVNSFFNNSTGFNDVVYTIAAQSNGDSYVGGMFTQYDGNSANKFIKLFSNGTIDTSFIVSSGFNDTVLACIDSPSGPYVFGEFTSYGGSTKRGIVKLDEFGAIDNSNFNVSTGLGTSSYATCGAIDKDEKLLVGGSFTSFNSDTCSNIMRLMQDGTFDNTFVQGSGFNDVVNCIAVLSTGDYMVGGMFTSYNGSSVSGIVKIRPNGSRNAIFSCTISGGAASILSISETNYGKFLISGNFTTVNGVTCNNLARINSDGTIDPTFTVPTGLDDTTFNIIDSSDRYLIFGEYTEYQGEGVNFLLRIAEKLYSIRFAPVDLDLKEDLQFPLNFNIADIRTPQNRKSNYSKTIDLPGTDKNSKVFAQLFEIDVDSTYSVNRKCDAFVIQDGLEIFSGSIKLNSITRKDWMTVSYSVSLDGELTNLFNLLKNDLGKDLMISDLDITEYSHALDRNAILDSWIGVITKDGAPYDNIIQSNATPVSNTGFAQTARTIFLIPDSSFLKKGDVVRFVMDAPNSPTVNFNESQGMHTIVWFANSLGLPVDSDDPTCIGPVVNLSFKSGDINSGTLYLCEATGEGYVYPTVTYGNTSHSEIVNTDNLRIDWLPWVYVKTYWDKIFERLGFTYSSTFLNGQVFKRLIVNSLTDFKPEVIVERLIETLPYNDDLLLEYDTVVTNEGEVWDLTNFWYTNGATNDSPLINLKFNISSLPVDAIIYVRIFRSLESDGVTPSTTWPLTGNNLDNNGTPLKFYLLDTNPIPGQPPVPGMGTTIIAPGEIESNIKIDWITLYPGEQLRFHIELTTSNPDNGIIDFSRLSIKGGSNVIQNDMTAKDFLISLINAFNLYVEPDRFNPSNVIIEPFDTYYSGPIIDWTKKVDISKDIEIEPVSPSLTRYYRFSYDKDGDFLNDNYQKQFARTYGDYVTSIETDFSDKTTETLIKFASTPLYDISVEGNVICPGIFKDSNQTPSDKFKPRLGYYTGLRYSKIDFEVNGNTSSTDFDLPMYGYAGHLNDPLDASLDIGFGVPTSIYYGQTYLTILSENTLFNVYHSKYLSELSSESARFVKMHLLLNSTDITNLSFRSLYWINGVLYRLQKISDYNPINTKPVLCEFTKVERTNASIGGSNPPDDPSFSTRSLSSVGSTTQYYASAAPVIQPLTNAWTISFRVQLVPTPVPFSYGYAYFNINTTTPDFCEFFIEVFEDFIGISANTQLGNQYYVAYAIPNTQTADWAHIAITRDPSYIDDWTVGSCIRVYVDTVENTSGVLVGSGTYSSVGSVPSTLAVALGSNNDQTVRLDEIYMCSHVCTPSEVTNVLYPNLMDTNDSGWDRQFWYRIEDTDTDSLIQNKPVDPSTTLSQSIGGVLSTNVDPVIS